ncbi:hypothetical protein [Dermabacter hominis]|uniref:hypothetical protein n=1 Tax=Dermabacter hominis TaxID=36740 RepID=UPI002431E498|nr:hypothetical protein [Dermabacter hominis]
MEYYFNTHGEFIAFRQSPDARFLFDKFGQWIGWFPWGDADAVDKHGKYLGTVVRNRLVARISQPYRGYPGYPGYPGYAGHPGYPGYAGYSGYLAGFEDVPADRLKG